MSQVQKHLSDLRESIVNEVEGERYFLDIVNELVRQFPASHGEIDKVHIVWGRCLRDVLWLGWLSEAKKRRGAYNEEICQEIEDSLKEALEIGRAYAQERP